MMTRSVSVSVAYFELRAINYSYIDSAVTFTTRKLRFSVQIAEFEKLKQHHMVKLVQSI